MKPLFTSTFPLYKVSIRCQRVLQRNQASPTVWLLNYYILPQFFLMFCRITYFFTNRLYAPKFGIAQWSDLNFDFMWWGQGGRHFVTCSFYFLMWPVVWPRDQTSSSSWQIQNHPAIHMDMLDQALETGWVKTEWSQRNNTESLAAWKLGRSLPSNGWPEKCQAKSPSL